MAYERRVGRTLSRCFPSAKLGQWIRFCDAQGTGFAQPDCYVALAEKVLVFESKLSSSQDGLGQIAALYRPLLRHIFRKPVVGVMVVKYLYADPGELEISSPLEALAKKEEELLVWQFLG